MRGNLSIIVTVSERRVCEFQSKSNIYIYIVHQNNTFHVVTVFLLLSQSACSAQGSHIPAGTIYVM